MSDAAPDNKDHFNAQAAGNVGAAVRKYNELAAAKAGSREDRETLLNTIYAQRQLVLVTPDDEDADIHAQLVSEDKRDKVHPTGTLAEFKKNRLGREGDSKQAYALVVPGEDGNSREVLAVIYTYWSSQPEGAMGVLPEDLPGQVNEILAEPSNTPDRKPNTVIFYSISSFLPRAGQTLIEDLHAQIGREAKGRPIALSTLSPFRSFVKWTEGIGRSDISELGDSQLTTLALDCLLANQDAVEKFHLSNGAYIGAVRLHANADGTKDATEGHGVMINYVYPADPRSLERNSAAYKQGLIPLHPDLYGSLDAIQQPKAVPVSGAGRAVNNNEPPPPAI